MTRKFYPREIDFIKTIVSDIRHDVHHQYVLLNAFADIFYYNAGTIAYNEGSLLFSYEDFKDKTAELIDIEQEVIERALLVKELKDENYIYFILDHEGEEFPYGKIAEGKTPLSKKLPQDIVEILDLLKYRVIISTSLCTLLDNNFRTIEEQTLDVAQEQLKEAKRQTQFTRKQAEEAKAQTIYAEKQVVEAKEQTSLAREQVEEAKKQTKNSLRQTYAAIGALVCSILGLAYTAYQVSLTSKTLESHMAEQQPIYHISEDIPNIAAPYYCQLIIENTGSQTIGNPYVNIKTIYEFVRCDANQYPNQWDTVYFNVAYWLWPIVLSNVDTVCVTSNNSSDYIFSNLQTACNTFSDSGTRYMLYKHDYISINYTDIYNRKHTKYYRDGFPISYETYKQETNVVEEHQCRVQDIRWETLVDALQAKSTQ